MPKIVALIPSSKHISACPTHCHRSIKNGLDVISITDAQGNELVQYEYDKWDEEYK